MTRDQALEKIKKCMALASSANEHEAAAALRQAQALMRSFDVVGAELLGVTESEAGGASGATPPEWECMLANMVAKTFGCEYLFRPGCYGCKSSYFFIGCESAPEVCKYAFVVLLRQIRRARAAYQKNTLGRRYSRATKVRLGDIFCVGWLVSAGKKVSQLSRTEQEDAAVNEFLTQRYPAVKDLKARDRIGNGTRSGAEHLAYGFGRMAGADVSIHHGVATEYAEPLQLGAD